jgi:hypothetical protein
VGCYLPPAQNIEMPDFSVGPTSSKKFPNLVKDAIPSEQGKIHVFGQANWHGFNDNSKTLHFTDPYFSGVVALSDTDVLLLMWNENAMHYQIVEQVPYENIRYQPKHEWGSTGGLTIMMDKQNIAIGNQSYSSRTKTYLQFILPEDRRIDREKNRLANLLVEEKVEKFIPDYSGNTFEDDY